MNIIDVECRCGRRFRWLRGTLMLCPTCIREKHSFITQVKTSKSSQKNKR
jgi:hypothetical protein